MEKLYERALKDPARNYFICQTLIKDKNTYEEVWKTSGDEAVILKRKSGTAQIIVDDRIADYGVYIELYRQLMRMDWKRLVVSSSVKEMLVKLELPVEVTSGSLIAMCPPENWVSQQVPFLGQPLESKDLPEVVRLYKNVFTGFSSMTYMAEKLLSKRGRGVVVRDQQLLAAVAQSDFESDAFALIVGVASDPSKRKMGYGESAFSRLCEQLVLEGKTLHLIYENPIAGELYKKYGFKIYDQNYHLERIVP